MTIIVSIAVPEGIVFSADSRQTYTNSRMKFAFPMEPFAD